MAVGFPRRVHVAAVGYYLDRVWEVPVRTNAERLWLVVDAAAPHAPERRFRLAIRSHLARVAPQMEVRERPAPLWDFPGTLRAYVDILASEMRAGSEVWVNVSTGSKLQGVAAALAAMSQGARLYYVVAKSFQRPPPTPRGARGPRPIASGVQEVVHLPSYRLDRPSVEDLAVLRALKGAGGREVAKTRLVDAMMEGAWREEPLTRARERVREARRQSGYVRLNRALDRLGRPPAKVAQSGGGRRHKVSLTEDGRLALLLMGAP